MVAEAANNDVLETKRPGFARPRFWINAAAVFLVAWLAAFLISYFAFPARFLVVDDPNTYHFFKEYTTWQFLCEISRVYSNLFLWLGLRLCDNNMVGLKVYGAMLFAFLVLALFLLNYAISRKIVLSWIFSLPIVISRLDWYFLIAVQGMMESVSLTACCMSVFFLVLFIESRKDRFFFLSSLFYLFAIFGHERYFPVGLLLIVTAFFFARGLVRKAFFPAFPALAFLFFYWFKTAYLGMAFWAVTGTQQISLSFEVLFDHFFKVLHNTIDFDCDQIWFAGYSNEALAALNQRWIVSLFSFPSAFVLVLFVPVMIVQLFTKKAPRAYTGALLLGFALALAAAGSVSPERVEMRWCFSAQLFVFAILCFTLSELPYALSKDPEIGKSRFASKITITVLSGALAVCFIASNAFFLSVKGVNFYIDNDQAKMEYLYSRTVEPMLEEEKHKIWVSTSDNWVYDFNLLFRQLKEVEEYVIDSPSNPGVMPEDEEQYYFVTFYE